METHAALRALTNTKGTSDGSKRLYEDSYRILGSHVIVEQDGRPADERESTKIVEAARRGHLFGVFDGVGSAPLGRAAAEYMSNRLTDFLRPEKVPVASVESLRALLCQASDELVAMGPDDGTKSPVAATVGTVAWFQPSKGNESTGKLCVLHAGDTEAVLASYGRPGMRTLTTSHSVGNVVTNYFGLPPDRLTIEILEVEMSTNDLLIVYSDGVSKGQSPERIAEAIHERFEPLDVARALAQRARSAGSTDDITALVVAVEEW
jgi:serine/threonine protein phosphatase PrpC